LTSTALRRGSAGIPGRVVRRGRWSIRVSPRSIAVCLCLAILTTVLALVSIGVGEFPLSPAEVWAALLGRGGEQAEFIVMGIRLPRVLTAILTGAAFGMSGAVFQSLARNPLGSPDIVGFDSGAALGAVIVIVLTSGSSREAAVGAVIGGLVTAVLVFLLSWGRGIRTYRLVLVGIGIGFVATAVVELILSRAVIYDLRRASLWLIGSLNGRGWDDVTLAAMSLLVLGPFTLALHRRLVLLELGDDVAAALGIRVTASKLALSITAVLLAAMAVAVVGPVAFVAFVCAPVARRLVASPHPAVLPSAFVGALLMVAADIVARRAFAPNELPVGLMTAVVGAPYLIWLLTRQIRTGGL
jgi:iron complex transport system permease protein